MPKVGIKHPISSGGGGADEKVKVSSNDTTEGYLNGKLVGSTYIDLVEQNDGGNESLRVDFDQTGLEQDLESVFLKLDQASPQTITNGAPDFSNGIEINGIEIYESSNNLFIKTINEFLHGLRVGGNTDNISIYQSGIDRNGSGDMNFTNNAKIRFGTGVPFKKYFEINADGSVSINDQEYTLPNTDGAAGQVLTTDGSGNVSFQNTAQTYFDSDVEAYLTGLGTVTIDPTDLVLIEDLTDNTLKQVTAQSIADLYDGDSDYLRLDATNGPVTGALEVVGSLEVDNILIDGNTISSTDTNGDVNITPNGTGDLVLDGIKWPQTPGTSGNVLVTDGVDTASWQSVGGGSGIGDVSGPGSATDNAIARFDGATGKIIQNSVGILTDAGELSGLTRLDVDNIRVDGNTISSTDTDGNINLTPNGTGSVVIDGNAMPQGPGTNGYVLQTDGAGQTSWAQIALTQKVTRTVTIGRQGSNSQIQVGRSARIPISYPATITGWRIREANEYAGSIVIDVKKGSTYAGAVSIAGTEKPTLSSSDENQNTTLSTWTTGLLAGDDLWLNIESNSGCYNVVLVLEMELV